MLIMLLLIIIAAVVSNGFVCASYTDLVINVRCSNNTYIVNSIQSNNNDNKLRPVYHGMVFDSSPDQAEECTHVCYIGDMNNTEIDRLSDHLDKDPRVLSFKWMSTSMRKSRLTYRSQSMDLPREFGYEPASRQEVASRLEFDDPVWPLMWYLNPLYKLAQDMDVHGAWKLGYTGRNVKIVVVDDGLETVNHDLTNNYLASISTDVLDNDPDPMPVNMWTGVGSHGTKCAGIAAASGNNSFCGVGVAFNAYIGGIRLIGASVTDAREAKALFHANSLVDIYSSSWGPVDDGRELDGPGDLTKEALRRGTMHGRQGLGSIYVWAAGNGGPRFDHCSYDGYINSPYTSVINSADCRQMSPVFAEQCAGILATTYSADTPFTGNIGVVTSDTQNECTTKYMGTSVSAPLAAGIIALALEANPKMTWRTVQHLIVASSRPLNLTSVGIFNKKWRTNAKGWPINEAFGFGLMNAKAATTIAERWLGLQLPSQRTCIVVGLSNKRLKKRKLIADHPILTSTVKYKLAICTDGCHGTQSEINSLEYVHLNISLTMLQGTRGSLKLKLTSPSGTMVTMIENRPYDKRLSGFNGWPIKSVLTWGENPIGCWSAEFTLRPYYMKTSVAELVQADLILTGMNELEGWWSDEKQI